MFNRDEEMYCETLLECSIAVFRYGLIGNYDDKFTTIDNYKTFANWSALGAFQIAFNVLVSVILLNVVFGIIVDTFSEIRNKKWDAERDMRDSCFLCSRDSFEFDRTKTGFLYHVGKEHNMWDYIQYFVYLNDTRSKHYFALDLYAFRELKADSIDFLPLDRALCLSNFDEEGSDSRIDQVLANVTLIRERQKKQAIKARLREEDERMLMFQKIFMDYKKAIDLESVQTESIDVAMSESIITDSEV
ncbi:DgyrCDS13085 [Dimorphilus gyrociliatus]|uniref:DgyrCDS13085 n=1 Tax=Dimorphilus gyrociliatus TaxID=2664684 RepID=A0A7I8W9K6_9ANNE|nr:DgyrCDS13085 [Dimorphilus gyrociliatus]